MSKFHLFLLFSAYDILRNETKRNETKQIFKGYSLKIFFFFFFWLQLIISSDIYIQYQNYVTWYKLLLMMIEKTMICLALFCLSVSAWVVIFGKTTQTKFNWFQHGLIAVCVHHKNKVSAPGTVHEGAGTVNCQNIA